MEFESDTGEVWPLNVGQVYTTLQRLERDGLVASNDGEDESPQKGYRITPAGSRELAAWLQTPPDTSPPPRDELVIKVLVALRLPGVEVQELIQVHRRHLVELMQRYTHLKAETSEHDVGLALVADAELFRLEAVVRWLDAADARLASLPAARLRRLLHPLDGDAARWRLADDYAAGAAAGMEALRVGTSPGTGAARG
jgi:DNA-binding PadR family transcriptional regulator